MSIWHEHSKKDFGYLERCIKYFRLQCEIEAK
jgi:hypothetical protein